MIKIFSEYHLYSNPSPTKVVGRNVGKILVGIFFFAVSAYAISGLMHYYQVASLSHFKVLTSVLGPLGFRATFWTAAAAGFTLGLGLMGHGSGEIHLYRKLLEAKELAIAFLKDDDPEDRATRIKEIKRKRDSDDSNNTKMWKRFLGSNLNSWEDYKGEYSKITDKHYKVFNVGGGKYFIVIREGEEFMGTKALTRQETDDLVKFIAEHSDYEPMRGGTEEKGS